MARNIWISCARVAGTDNVQADELSRKFHIDTEWKLDTRLLYEALALLNIEPSVDFFASRVNHQFPRYAFFQPDPNACAIDTITMTWNSDVIYCFSPL